MNNMVRRKENNMEQGKVIKHIKELLDEECFDGYTDTENVKRVLREVLELLNVR
jgi:hypothetical protein